MWCVTLDMYSVHGFLWLYSNYVLVNDKNTESLIDAVRAGVVADDDVEDVCTVWQYTTEIAESYSDWDDVTVEIDGEHYVIYIYCNERHAQYFVDEFSYLPDYCIDSEPAYEEIGYGCCGDTNSDDDEYNSNWGLYE